MDDEYLRTVAQDIHHLHQQTDPAILAGKLRDFMMRHGGLGHDHATEVVRDMFRRGLPDQHKAKGGEVAPEDRLMMVHNLKNHRLGDIAGEHADALRRMEVGRMESYDPNDPASMIAALRKFEGQQFASGGTVDKAIDVVGQQQEQPVAVDSNPVNVAQQVISSPRPKFSISRAGTAPASPASMGAYQFQTLAPGEVNTNSLKEAFQRGIQRHLSLPEGERIANSRAAIKALEPYLGRRKSGEPIALLSQNQKLLKAQTGTAEKAPIELDDGRGVETIGLSLYPDFREGTFQMCPNSASCRDECLGKTSGQYSQAFTEAQEKAGGVSARKRAMNRTMAMMRQPEAFAVRLWDDIESARREAERNGNHLGVRLNTLSDINPIVHKPIIESQPDVSFYDYTKMGWNPVAENHHYTHSSTGVSQEDVDNPHSNWRKVRRKMDQGDNVAMVFSGTKKLPSFVHDQETGKKYRVIDGKSHDFRPLDMLENEGPDGVIVGLSNLKSTGKWSNHHIDSKGFFVHYDPKKHGDTVPIIPQQKKGATND